MVLELAGHGDLLEYVKLRGALPDDKARQMFSQLLSAVAYMHSLDIVHRYRIWGKLMGDMTQRYVQTGARKEWLVVND
jgi:hypothetical protein